MSTAVMIARFQSPYLHEGHVDLIDRIRQKHNKLVVVLGISPVKGARKNPYDYHTRERMLKQRYPEIVVLPLRDHPSNAVWSANLDDLLEDSFPAETFMLYGSRDSFIPAYSGRHTTEELPEQVSISATEIRAKYADKVFDSEDFRAGILYALHNQYPRVFPTVDIAVLRNNRTEILLGQKHRENQWRLVGGFVDPTDESALEAAKRELAEEVGPIEVGTWQYETTMRVDDWRYRHEADSVMTTLFTCTHQFGAPTAQDDLAGANWFSLHEIAGMIARKEVVASHIPLLNYLLNVYQKDLAEPTEAV